MDWIDRIGRRMKLRDLHIFLTVAQAGTMGRAAAALSVSQPAVSKAISGLETALKVRLFDRTARGIALTPYGEALKGCGRAVFDELQKGVRTLEFLGDPSGGSLHVGCTEFGAMGLVPLALERLALRHRKVQLSVTTADPEWLASVGLPQRSVEVAGCAIPRELPADIEAERLFDDSQIVMAGIGSPWARRRKLRLADIVEAPWVLPPAHSPMRAHIDAAFVSQGLRVPVAQVATFSMPLCHQLLASGKYLAILPRGASLLARHLPIQPLKVDFPAITRPVGLMTLKGRTPSPLARLFTEAARAAAEAVSP